MKFQATAILTAALLISPLASRADTAPFGVASAYNLFAVGTDATHGSVAGTISTSADVNGRIAAADKVLTGTTVMSNLNGDPWGAGVQWAIISQNGLNAGTSFNVNDHGHIGNVYAPGTNGSMNFNNSGDGVRVTSGGVGFSFDDVRVALDNQTAFLGALGATGTNVGFARTIPALNGVNPSNYVLYGTDPTLNVFTLTAADLAAMGSNHQLDVHAPVGSTIIINVQGTNITLNTGGAFLYNGQQYSDDNTATNHILFNFPTATSVNIQGALSASVLAPYAVLTSGSQIDGNFIAAQIGPTGQVHNVEFTGTLPPTPTTLSTSPVPEPSTLLMVGSGLLSVAGAVRRKLKGVSLS